MWHMEINLRFDKMWVKTWSHTHNENHITDQLGYGTVLMTEISNIQQFLPICPFFGEIHPNHVFKSLMRVDEWEFAFYLCGIGSKRTLRKTKMWIKHSKLDISASYQIWQFWYCELNFTSLKNNLIFVFTFYLTYTFTNPKLSILFQGSLHLAAAILWS